MSLSISVGSKVSRVSATVAMRCLLSVVITPGGINSAPRRRIPPPPPKCLLAAVRTRNSVVSDSLQSSLAMGDLAPGDGPTAARAGESGNGGPTPLLSADSRAAHSALVPGSGVVQMQRAASPPRDGGVGEIGGP